MSYDIKGYVMNSTLGDQAEYSTVTDVDNIISFTIYFRDDYRNEGFYVECLGTLVEEDMTESYAAVHNIVPIPDDNGTWYYSVPFHESIDQYSTSNPLLVPWYVSRVGSHPELVMDKLLPYYKEFMKEVIKEDD